MSWADKAEEKIAKAVEAGRLGAEGGWNQMGKWKQRGLLLAQKFEEYREKMIAVLIERSAEIERQRVAQEELLAEVSRLKAENARLKHDDSPELRKVVEAAMPSDHDGCAGSEGTFVWPRPA